MKTIYFIRHGQGFHNLDNGYHIRYPRLTPNGMNQCDKLKNELKEKNIDVIFTSPLLRALETSYCIFGSGVRTIAVDCIREIVKNPCDIRQSKEDLQNKFSYVNFKALYDNYDYNKKETPVSIKSRIQILLRNLKAAPFKNIAVVSHGGFLDCLFKSQGFRFGIDNYNYMKNCELRLGIYYNWLRLRCTFKNNDKYYYMNAEKNYVSFFDTKLSWWSARWREDYFENEYFQLICLNTGENKGGANKILSYQDNSIIVVDPSEMNDLAVWKKKYVVQNWFILEYYKVKSLDFYSKSKDNYERIGRLEYDIINKKLYLETDDKEVNLMIKHELI